MRSFRSDNNAGLCPEALSAMVAAAEGHQVGYGDDDSTARATAAFRAIFGDDIEVGFVATGTAANTLAIASLTEPWESIVCLDHSHLNDDESTAPERITNCRLIPVAGDANHKLSVATIDKAGSRSRGDVHQPQPGVVSISNVTEFGTVYQPGEVRAIADAAHRHGFRLHVDGARFANAVASVGCDPGELAGAAGVDALSFGGTKNGLAFGEAVVFFPQGDGAAFQRARRRFEFQRKSTGHLLSKHRFVTAPFAATLAGGIWLAHAAHANQQARRLAAGLSEQGIVPRYPVEANGVFVELPAVVDKGLKAAGHGYYPFGDPAGNLSRLMTSFDTTAADRRRAACCGPVLQGTLCLSAADIAHCQAEPPRLQSVSPGVCDPAGWRGRNVRERCVLSDKNRRSR